MKFYLVKIPETKESDSLRAKSTDNLKNKPQENNKPLKKVSSLEDNLNVNIKQDQENKPIELERKNLKVLEQNQENKPSELDRKNSKPVDEGSKLKKHIIKTDKVKNTLRNNL